MDGEVASRLSQSLLQYARLSGDGEDRLGGGEKKGGDIYPSVKGLPHCKHTSSYMTVVWGGGECEVGEDKGRMRERLVRCGLTGNILK